MRRSPAVERDLAAAVDDDVGLVVEDLGRGAHADRDRVGAAVEGDDAALRDRRDDGLAVQLAGVPVPTTWSGRDVSAWPAPGGIGARPFGLPGVGCCAVTRVMLTARSRKPAVSARVMSRPGQNLPLPQPIATPAFISLLIAVANGLLLGTSCSACCSSPSARAPSPGRRPSGPATRGRRDRTSCGPQPDAMPAVTTLLIGRPWGVR